MRSEARTWDGESQSWLRKDMGILTNMPHKNHTLGTCAMWEHEHVSNTHVFRLQADLHESVFPNSLIKRFCIYI